MVLPFKRVIPESELQKLDKYSFKSGNHTYVDALLYKVLWHPFSLLLPSWLHPNLLTLVGGLSVFTINFLVFYYIPNFKSSSVPPWTSLLSALMLFFYITFDGVDGMHARRLKLASPLGQLLDHGTDAVVSSFFGYFAFLLNPNGYKLLNALIAISSQINTAAVDWREEEFGKFSYRNDFFFFGVSEPLLSVIAMLLLNYFFPDFWLKPIHKHLRKFKSLRFMTKYLPRHLNLYSAFLYVSVLLSFYTFLGFPYEMFKKNKDPKPHLRFFAYILFNCILPPLLTLFLPLELHTAYCLFSSSFTGFGLLFIIISSITSKTRSVFYPEFALHYLLLFFSYGLVLSNKLFGLNYDKLFFNEPSFKNTFLALAVLGTSLGLLKAVRTIYEIKTYMGLNFFTTSKRKKKS